MNKKVLIAGSIAIILLIAGAVTILTQDTASNKEFTNVEGSDSLPHALTIPKENKIKIPSVDEGHSVSYLNDYYDQAIVMNDKYVLSQLPKYDTSIAEIIRKHSYPMSMVHYVSRYNHKKCEFRESMKAIVSLAKNPQNETQKDIIKMLSEDEKNNIKKFVKECLS